MTPLERFTAICEAQGRKLAWVAEKAGLTPSQLASKLRGRPRYPLHQHEKEAIAAALGVPAAFIWCDEKPEERESA